MAEELKACPFCGGDANAAPESQHYPGCYFDVLASLRAAKGGDISLVPEVLRAWNRRAQMPSQGGEAVKVVAWLSETFANGRTTQHAALSKTSLIGLRHGTEDSAAEIISDEPLMTVAQHQRILAAITHPADQVTSAELLGRLAHYLECSSNLTSADYGGEGYDLARELRALLAKP